MSTYRSLWIPEYVGEDRTGRISFLCESCIKYCRVFLWRQWVMEKPKIDW